MKTSRTLIPVILGALVTFALFYLMVSLIFFDTDEIVITEPPPEINFSEVEPPKDAETKPPRHEEPPPPDDPPPPPDLTISTETPNPPIDVIDIPTPTASGNDIYIPQPPNGNANNTAEGQAVALVRIQPVYPPDALRQRIEGWVTIQFTITPSGAVKDPKVIDSKPRRVFDQAALRSIIKWKFKPRVINGKAVESSAIQTLEFKLEN